MRALAQTELLALWERGSHRHRLDRTVLLTVAARPDVGADAVLDLPLGAVTTALLKLRAASFGARIDSHADCERCGQRLEFTLDVDRVLQPEHQSESERIVNAAGLRVRAPSLRDLIQVADEPDANCAARRLLTQCTLGGHIDGSEDEVLRVIEDALEAVDPNADLALSIRCVACDLEATVLLDAGALLWDEIETHALRLLREIHLLASAYGWSEPEILALSGVRRASYLAMVGA